jgi:hypothetical protein
MTSRRAGSMSDRSARAALPAFSMSWSGHVRQQTVTAYTIDKITKRDFR